MLLEYVGDTRQGRLMVALSALLVVGCATKARVAASSRAGATPSVSAARPLAAAATAAVARKTEPPWLIARTPAMEAALAHDLADLERLRTVPLGNRLGCAQFRSIELAAGLAKRRALGENPINECSDEAARRVTCFETPAGFFVPVEQLDGMCSYRLWFVPHDAERRPVPVSEVFEEFDLAFTVRLEPDDLYEDGVDEALLIRGWSHPEGVSEGQEAYVVEPSGKHRRLPFDDFKDVDGDGRLDAIVSFASTDNATGCEPAADFQPWVPRYLAGPELVLHRVAGLKFSLTDAAARAARAKACENLGTSVIARRAGVVDEDETQRRAVCRLADGGDPATIGRALAEACLRDFQIPADCKKRRPGVCFWRSTLVSLPAAIAALRPWLADATVP